MHHSPLSHRHIQLPVVMATVTTTFIVPEVATALRPPTRSQILQAHRLHRIQERQSVGLPHLPIRKTRNKRNATTFWAMGRSLRLPVPMVRGETDPLGAAFWARVLAFGFVAGVDVRLG